MQGKAKLGKSRQSKAMQGNERLDKAKLGKARRPGKAPSQGSWASLGRPRHCYKSLGKARKG
jgi:hypothetical protein